MLISERSTSNGTSDECGTINRHVRGMQKETFSSTTGSVSNIKNNRTAWSEVGWVSLIAAQWAKGERKTATLEFWKVLLVANFSSQFDDPNPAVLSEMVCF